ncbi:MAG: hypothetical protein RL291_116, partial [Pseudomonadota bacterium]
MTEPISQQRVLEALRSRSSWPNRPERVDVIETHAALIFLANEDVLKVRRAVRLSYLDYTTLEARRRACIRELELNARHAPDLYRGLAPIRQMPDGQIKVGSDTGEIVEWSVSMRRFPQGALLSEMAVRGALDTALIKKLADRAYAFHRDAPQSAEAVDTIETVAQSVSDAILQSASADVLAVGREVEALLRHAAEDTRQVRALRAAAGSIRRCHGDLHLRNIVLWRGVPTPFDALEFDEGLATIDTLYDLAFLIMDIDRKASREHANALLNRYLWRSGAALDLEGLEALPLFLGLRAAVRALVSLDRASIAPSDNAGTIQHAKDLLEAATRYLNPAPPSLVAIGGLSGSGKTTLAASLAPLVGAAPGALHLRTDLERKWLVGVEELDRLPDEAYSDRQTRATYERVAKRAETALAAGHSVVVDGVFANASERASVEAIASAAAVPFRGLWLD